MAVVGTTGNHYKKLLADFLATHTVKVLLMRDGFVFNKDTHQKFINIRTSAVINATGNTITVSNATKTFTRTTGSFITDGFVVGNKVTTTNFTNATNNGAWLISVLTATVMTVTTTAGGSPTLVDETNTTVTNLTWASDDELATGFGYTQNTKTTGTITATEDLVNDRADDTFPTVTWTAAGGSIGPTPGVLFFDDTSADKTILAVVDFGGNVTTLDTQALNLNNGIFRYA